MDVEQTAEGEGRGMNYYSNDFEQARQQALTDRVFDFPHEVVGNKIYARCDVCGKIVCLNKTIFGALHICDRDN